MISARRAAALGLTVPLSAIMNAVLGLWPEPEDDAVAPRTRRPTADPRGGGDGEPAPRRKTAKEVEEDYWNRLVARRDKHNSAAVLAAVAIAELEYT